MREPFEAEDSATTKHEHRNDGLAVSVRFDDTTAVVAPLLAPANRKLVLVEEALD